MKIKPEFVYLKDTGWKVGDKIKCISSSFGFHKPGQVYTIQRYYDTDALVTHVGWNGYSTVFELVEEKSQLEFDFDFPLESVG